MGVRCVGVVSGVFSVSSVLVVHRSYYMGVRCVGVRCVPVVGHTTWVSGTSVSCQVCLVSAVFL